MKGLGEDLHVVLNVSNEKILAGANADGCLKVLNSREISEVAENDRAKIIELDGTAGIGGIGKSYRPVKDKSVLRKVKGYESAEEALNDAIEKNYTLL